MAKEKQTCSTCYGSQKCGICRGKGKRHHYRDIPEALITGKLVYPRSCEFCYSTGKCQTCEGTGYEYVYKEEKKDSKPNTSNRSRGSKRRQSFYEYNSYRSEPSGPLTSRGPYDDVITFLVGLGMLAIVVGGIVFLILTVKNSDSQPHLKNSEPVQQTQTERVYIENPAAYPLNDNVVHKHTDPIAPTEERTIEQIPLEEESSIPQVVPEITMHYDQYGRPISAEGRPLYKIYLEDGIYSTIDNCNQYVGLSIRGNHLLLEGVDNLESGEVTYTESYYCTSSDEPNTYFFSENSEIFIRVVAENEITFFNHNRMCRFKKIQ